METYLMILVNIYQPLRTNKMWLKVILDAKFNWFEFTLSLFLDRLKSPVSPTI